MVTAVELSYLPEEEQKQVCKVRNEHGGRIKNAQAVELHNAAGSLTENKVKNILVGDVKPKTISDTKLFAQIKKKYFRGKTTEEMINILEQALVLWFDGGGMRVFDTKQFKKINPQYFNIIMLSEHDVTVQSRNTGHYWYLHSTAIRRRRTA